MNSQVKEEHISIKEMWHKYLESINENPETTAKSYKSWFFDNNQQDADLLAELVLKGKKCATASALSTFEYESIPIPEVGDLNIITNWQGIAQCIIESTNIEITSFDMVSEEFAQIEGEGDSSLEYWRKAHKKYFTEELSKMGKEFSENMFVVCEQFKIVYK